MFLHQHPYPPFIPEKATKLIIGTLPPPRFSTGTLFPEDVDFCYGSKYGLLWPILDEIFNLGLTYENTSQAIEERKKFLTQHKIGICDIIENCLRSKIDASDAGMSEIKLRNVLYHIKNNKHITTLLFMGGNSKNGPEYLFRKLLKPINYNLDIIDLNRPRIHELRLNGRIVRTVSLISPSSAANRSIGADAYYKSQKKSNQQYTTFDYRVEQFEKYFI